MTNNNVYFENNLVGPAAALFLVYMTMNTSYIAKSMSCRTQEFAENNILASHIGVFMMVFFFMTTTTKNPRTNNEFVQQFIFAILMYVGFLLTTVMPLEFVVVLLSILAINYIIHRLKQVEVYKVFDNPNLTLKEKYKRRENNYSVQYLFYSRIQYWLIFSSIILSGIGTLYYLGKKKIEYQDIKNDKSWNYWKFFFRRKFCEKENKEIFRKIENLPVRKIIQRSVGFELTDNEKKLIQIL